MGFHFATWPHLLWPRRANALKRLIASITALLPAELGPYRNVNGLIGMNVGRTSDWKPLTKRPVACDLDVTTAPGIGFLLFMRLLIDELSIDDKGLRADPVLRSVWRADLGLHAYPVGLLALSAINPICMAASCGLGLSPLDSQRLAAVPMLNLKQG